MLRSLLTLFAIGLALLGCNGLNILTVSQDSLMRLESQLTEAEIEAFIGATIPESSTNIYEVGYSALDTMVAIRFDLPAAELLPYLQELGITKSLQPGNSPFISTDAPYEEAISWWQVVAYQETSDISYEGLREVVSGKNYHILVINTDEYIVTVYMKVFNT